MSYRLFVLKEENLINDELAALDQSNRTTCFLNSLFKRR